MKYVMGLDIGIGSIGWAVINAGDKKRIEDFGVRIFDSGENPKSKTSKAQDRRAFRSQRRLVRRRSYRKKMLKFHLQNIGLTSVESINRYFEDNDKNIIAIRARGLDEKLTPEEIYFQDIQLNLI